MDSNTILPDREARDFSTIIKTMEIGLASISDGGREKRVQRFGGEF
jgi:hypothetical protein